LSLAPNIRKNFTVNLGSLDDLDLSDLDMLDWEDLAGLGLDLVVDNFSSEVIQYLIDIALVDLLIDNFYDLLSDSLNLRGKGIAGLTLLALAALGEGDCEDAQNIAVLGAAIAVGLNKSLPFFDKVAQLVTGSVQSVEAGFGVAAFDFIDDETDLSPEVATGLTRCQISLKLLNDSTLDGSINFVGSVRLVGTGEAERVRLKGDWRMQVEPFFPGEGINSFLLGTLLAHLLVFSLCHQRLITKISIN
jgi:GNAT superfamily N-acetyltransferase